MKHLKTILIWILIIATFLVVFLPLALINNSTNLIFLVGSSSMQPLMTEVAKKYNASDLIINGGGSGKGLSQVATGGTNIGMLSKTTSLSKVGLPIEIGPDFNINTKAEFYNEWNEGRIKTVTVAWDGIAVLYQGNINGVDLNLDITEKNIDKLFKAFAGIEQINYSELFNLTPEQQIKLKDIKVTPFVRSGGAKASGTADAFLNDNHLNYNITKQEKEALENGLYGPYAVETNESNTEAFNSMDASSLRGKLIYLSAGFVSTNKKYIEDKGYKIATYNGFNINNITDGYNWYRPFNLVFSLKSEQYIIDFITWLLSNDNAIRYAGYEPLSKEAKLTMCGPNKEFLLSDFELIKTESQDVWNKRISQNLIYGAYL